MPNKSLELTPKVRALNCLVRGVGIESMIESSGERSSAPIRWAAAEAVEGTAVSRIGTLALGVGSNAGTSSITPH